MFNSYAPVRGLRVLAMASFVWLLASTNPPLRAAGPAPATDNAVLGTSTKLTQDGITWTFEEPVQYGKFVSGDYWVLGPVTIKDVTPGWDGTINGSTVDPKVSMDQGYRKQWGPITPKFSDDLRTKFPLKLEGTHSLVSTIGLAKPVTNREGLDTVCILTVVDKIPPKDAFRPPYVAGDKPIYTASQLKWDRLPKLALPNLPAPYQLQMPQFDTVLQRTGLDHVTMCVSASTLHPRHRTKPRAGIDARDMASMSLLVMLDIPERQELTCRLVQLGIDLYPICLENKDAWAHGESGLGRKWPILFAGIMLDIDRMQALPGALQSTLVSGGTVDKFTEDAYTYYGKPTGEYPQGKPLFGAVVSEKFHADQMKAGKTVAHARDPNGLVDAGFREACSLTWVGPALAARLMGAQKAWNHPAFFDYVDRWVKEGGEASLMADRDPPAKTAYCYGNAFIKAMWDTYRTQASEIAKQHSGDR